MKSPIKVLALIACLPLSAGAQSLQCGQALIRVGTTKAEVSARCGQPAQAEHQSIYGESATGMPGGLAPRVPGGPLPPGAVLPGTGERSGTEIPIEVWTYNFGPSRLMQRIRFENGVVVKIESLGYGF